MCKIVSKIKHEPHEVCKSVQLSGVFDPEPLRWGSIPWTSQGTPLPDSRHPHRQLLDPPLACAQRGGIKTRRGPTFHKYRARDSTRTGKEVRQFLACWCFWGLEGTRSGQFLQKNCLGFTYIAKGCDKTTKYVFEFQKIRTLKHGHSDSAESQM